MVKENFKINIKDKIEENICDLSLSQLSEIPVNEIVSISTIFFIGPLFYSSK